MTHRTTYTMTEAAADAIVAKHGRSFNGRTFDRETATTISYYASHKDHAAFERLIASATPRVAAPVSTDEPATARQVAFLRELIDNDPGAASTIGATITPTLTKAQASRFIALLKAGV